MYLPQRYLTAVVAASAISASQAPAQEPDRVVLTVRVIDAATGAPLGGAVVQLTGIPERYVTAERGEASFSVATGSYVLTARRFGYEPLEGDFRVIRPGSFTLRMMSPSFFST